MSNKNKKLFGTDGVRGKVGEKITPEMALKLGWAAGKAFAETGKNTVLVGKDTRISGYMLESAMESGLAASGVHVRLLGPTPTPAIAYLTRTFRAAAGVVISASHNPYYDNGIKFFNNQGKKLDDATEAAIERWMDVPMEVVESDKIGRVKRLEGGRDRYVEFCKSSIPWGYDLQGLTIVVDGANGACYNTSSYVFEELGAKVIATGNQPNGFNINDNCGSTSPGNLQTAVLEHKADLGVALDGDGDRVVLVDHNGDVVDGDEILCIIAKERLETGENKAGVVGTLMTNFGAEKALKGLGYDFVRANVGDRYVMAELAKHGWQLGGEGSGHLICLDKTTTGDGTIAALQVLAAMRRTEKTLAEIKQFVTKMPQQMINLRVKDKIIVSQNAEIMALWQQAEDKLGDLGRVLIRASGTEPVIRVMVEAEDEALVTKTVESLASKVNALLA